MFLRPGLFTLFFLLAFAVFGFAQNVAQKEKPKKQDKNAQAAAVTAEQVAESVVLIFGTRDNLKQVRKTTTEFGKLLINNSDGSVDNVSYARRIVRGDDLFKEKVRLDQKFPNAEYSMVYDAGKIFGIFKDTAFPPKPETAKAFENQMFHGIEALLRYKENGSKLELQPKGKQMNVEYYVLDVIDKENRKTRFNISVKLLRVMQLEYTFDSVKYVRKFSDYRYAQNTLVPFHSTLYHGDKILEEVSVSTVTYGQKVDEGVFKADQ